MIGVREFGIESIYEKELNNTVIQVVIRKHVLCMNFGILILLTRNLKMNSQRSIILENGSSKVDIILTLTKSSLALRVHREDLIRIDTMEVFCPL